MQHSNNSLDGLQHSLTLHRTASPFLFTVMYPDESNAMTAAMASYFSVNPPANMNAKPKPRYSRQQGASDKTSDEDRESLKRRTILMRTAGGDSTTRSPPNSSPFGSQGRTIYSYIPSRQGAMVHKSPAGTGLTAGNTPAGVRPVDGGLPLQRRDSAVEREMFEMYINVDQCAQ